MINPFEQKDIAPELSPLRNIDKDLDALRKDVESINKHLLTPPEPQQELQIKIGCSGGFVVIELNPVRRLYEISKRDAKQLAKRLINEALK